MTSPLSREDLLRHRYGRTRTPDIEWNDQIEHLIAHRSQRSFTSEAVTDAQLATIVAAAQSASSSSNQHYWSVVAVTERETKERLAAFTQGPSLSGRGYDFVADAPMVLVWIADMARNHELTTGLGVEMSILDRLDAFLMASVDTGLAAQNALVAAESLGLGGVFLGSLRNRARELADLLELPRYSYAVVGMALGHPDPDDLGAIRPRPRQEVVLHRERYGAERPEGWVDEYEAAFLDFREGAGLRGRTWLDSVAVASGSDYLDGREDLRDTVRDRGFLLG